MAEAASKAASVPKSTKAETPGAASQKGAQKTSSSKLEDQAAVAALYVTKNQRKTGSEDSWLDGNNKLSSAGAAASLKYATAKDLPSYPSSGLPSNGSAAGAAASLGWANQKAFEHWKPDPSSAASAAAVLAKDYKMDPLWQPQQSSNGAKAAILAHRDGGKVDIWKPEQSSWGNSAANIAMQTQKKGTLSQPEESAWGNSAANIAFQTQKKGTLIPQPTSGRKDLGRSGSLLAATGAMAGSRQRAESTPIVSTETYPDQANAVANALSAATFAHKPSTSTKFSPAGTNTAVTNLPREMYTSSPLVGPEVEERERASMLRASAVAMAQKMYSIQQKKIDEAAAGLGVQSAASAYRRESVSSPGPESSPMRFNNLQEAAQKAAEERLSKLHDDHAQAREYREYYGDSKTKSSVSKRLSMNISAPRGRTRARASSAGAADDDKERSQKIREKMSLFSSNLSKVDAKKRQQDREALIAIAQQNVAKSLHGMDEQVFQKTGKVNPSLLNEWDLKAKAAAQAKSDSRMQNFGKVNIGGGKFVSQSDVDLVAARNVQPALDDINEKAALEHAKQIEIKADQEAAKRTEESKKQREKEEKDVEKKLKQQEKDEAKAAKEEEKRLAKAEKRKSKDGRLSFMLGKSQAKETKEPEATKEVVATEPTATPTTEEANIPLAVDTSEVRPLATEVDPAQESNATTKTSPTSGSPKSGGRVKSWFKTTFASVPHTNSRRASKSQREPGAFVGGAALTGASANNSLDSVPTVGAGAAAVGGTSDVSALAEDGADKNGKGKKRDDGSFRSASKTEDVEESRDDFDESLAPPAPVVDDRAGASSPVRETRFKEEIEL